MSAGLAGEAVAGALAPAFEAGALVPVGDWMPARYTPSLTGTEHFRTEGDRLLAFLAVHWRTEEAVEFLLDPWQRWLIRHVLEVYPEDWPIEHLRGQLRFRQVVVSMARQNGKSVIGAVLAFYYLTMHVRGPRVIGLASNDDQAGIVYNRVKYAIDESPALSREVKTTVSRGLTLRHRAGIYMTLPAKEASAQGEPVSGAIYDELHIGLAGLWDAIVLGQSARANSQLLGITTAGDDDSDLLIRLYADGEVALEGGDERFGFFVWEAASDEVTEANLIAASPAIACGRKDLAQEYADALKLYRAPKDKTGVTGRDRCVRYKLNRFVEGSVNAWASSAAWKAGALSATSPPLEHAGGVVFSLERTEAWEWVSIVATSRRPDGTLATELVAALAEPTHEDLVAACRALARTHPGSAFTAARARMKRLLLALVEHGLDVWQLGADEEAAAAATAKAAVSRRAVAHPGDPLVSLQFAQARRRDLGDSWRLSASLSTGDIDAIRATVYGLHVASVRTAPVMQIF